MNKDKMGKEEQMIEIHEFGKPTVQAGCIKIMGPSTVRCQKDPPAQFGHAWIETESEVRIDG